ncbi:MAG: 50S ribosomal protein L25 [Actinobacteria bacterium]|nr:50S ribosomal protein L25 [Actinomycetota bacterium]MCG2789587.1 50S ribosomal protein L25 [Actinomycetes bacterium]
MSNVSLKVESRSKEELKNNASRRLRAGGFIPATIYGQAEEPQSIKIDSRQLKEILKGKSSASLIIEMTMSIGGKNKKEITIIKETQKNPFTHEFTHIDFYRIQMEKEVETTVPVVILNEEESIGVKEEGGVVQHGLRELHIACLPMQIPERITYDILDLKMGRIIKVSDLIIGSDVRVLNHPEEIIVSIIHPTHLVVEEVAVEEEEAAAEPEVISKEKVSDKEKEEK